MRKLFHNNELNPFLDKLKKLNPHLFSENEIYNGIHRRNHKLQKVLVANRGEIAKRFFLTLHEEGINSVAIVTDADKGQSWYEFADEIVFIGEYGNYSNPHIIISATMIVQANAIYSGYGFLSENPDFVRMINHFNTLYNFNIIFMGPSYEAMSLMSDKINARRLAGKNNIPLFASSDVINTGDIETVREEAFKIGFPVMVKLCAGGGGKGMYSVYSEEELEHAVSSCMRTGSEIYGNSSFYLEKLIENPIHVEVQIFNGKAIGIRKCAVQRRNQKIIEESGETFLDDNMNMSLLALAEKIALMSGYNNNCGAGTVEFLIDQDLNRIGFLEMNTRLQVEYAVTDQSHGIDLAKCQILLYDGRENEFDYLYSLKYNNSKRDHSIECRIYAEDPENDYLPSPGIISEINLPTFNGIRCDFGFRDGDKILSMYDPMIGKLIVHGQSRHEALIRMERALQELYIKGVKTNISQLLNIIRHPEFIKGNYNNRIIYRIGENKKTESGRADIRHNYNHIIFGAFAEYLEICKQVVSEFFIISNIKGITNTPADSIQSRIIVEYDNGIYTVEFIQISFNSYYITLNDRYNGKLVLNFSNEKSDDLILMYRDKSYRIRIDRKNEFLILKLKEDATNKINYYNVRIVYDKYNENDNTEIIRSPFQGTFVSFCRDIKSGDIISAGDPLFILSAMKMETTICSPAEGRVIYIFTDSYSLKYQKERGSGVSISGKNIQEGEILLKIEKPINNQSDHFLKPVPLENTPPDSEPFNFFMNDDFETLIIEEPEKYIHLLFAIFYSIICGFTTQEYIIEKMHRIIRGIKFHKWKTIINRSLTGAIEKIILHYIYIKKIFSSTVSSDGISFCEELDIFIMQLHDEDINLSLDFHSLFLKILNYYGITETDFTLKSNRKHLQQILFYLRLSQQFIYEHPDFIKYIVYIIPYLNIPKNKILETTSLLLEREETEKDDTFAKYIKNEIYNKTSKNKTYFFSEDEHEISDIKYLFDYLGMDSEDYIQNICKNSLEEPEENLIPEYLNDYQKHELNLRLEITGDRYEIKRLKSPILDIVIFQLKERSSGEHLYLAFSIINLSDSDSVNRYELIERAAGNALSTISLYQNIRQSENNWMHIIISGAPLILENGIISTNELCYTEIKKRFTHALRSLMRKSQTKGILECDFQFSVTDTAARRQMYFSSDIHSTIFEFICNNDKRNIYHSADTFRSDNQKIFDQNKWPLETWAAECFDPGTAEELRIESIDYKYGTAEGDEAVSIVVGAKIYYGKISGNDACFFMKDSRVNRGSTGNLEGLKYTAAAYISFLKGWPFYVWNDGAGANINEGIVSLNRGAEGFMMNTLLVNGDYKKFERYTLNNSDPELIKLFKSLDKQFNLKPVVRRKNRVKLPLVAVGTGSSAGLDVYGSSQGVIQLMLNSGESYRVLTGSNVTKSVIGENISNYDIGGAEILGRRAGILDLIADNKIKLIHSVKKINNFFSEKNHTSIIRRNNTWDHKRSVNYNQMVILTESDISDNVDDSEFIELKKNYYGAESVLGGLAKIGGHPVLIIGTRTHFGHRSSVSVIKILELLKIAQKTSLSEILIFGKNWLQPEILEDNNFRPQLDFMNTLQKKNGLRIHIIMHAEGLKSFYINNSADVIIFIRDNETSLADNNLINKNSSFIVKTLGEAFDLSCRLNSLIYSSESSGIHENRTPAIPSDPSLPYDMIGSVILPVFDSNSFIEFFKEMNSLPGTSLITGLAKLNGMSVGIIADQPLQKGGAADAYSTEKFRVFTQFLNRLNIPLIMLSNSSGFLPGSQQERLRIQAIGAESLDVNILGQIPVVSVVLNQNYGGRLIHAFNKFLRPGIVYLALEDSILAVIGVSVAFDLLNKKKYLKKIETEGKDEAEIFKKDYYSAYLGNAKASNCGKQTGLVDWIIPDRKDLREHLIRGMDLAIKRCKKAFLDKSEQ